MRCETCSQTTDAAELPCDSVHRVEGASDPDDMALVIAFTCPHCDTRDALVLSYGAEAPAADADVLVALPDPPDDRESGLAR